jgi:MFS family permease
MTMALRTLAFTIGWSAFAFGTGRLVHRIGERLPCTIGIVVHILGLVLVMVAFAQGLAWVVVAALVSGAGMGLLSPALTVVVQNSVPVARMGSATTSQHFIRQVGAALGISAFVLAATAGGMEQLREERHGRQKPRGSGERVGRRTNHFASLCC